MASLIRLQILSFDSDKEKLHSHKYFARDAFSRNQYRITRILSVRLRTFLSIISLKLPRIPLQTERTINTSRRDRSTHLPGRPGTHNTFNENGSEFHFMF